MYPESVNSLAVRLQREHMRTSADVFSVEGPIPVYIYVELLLVILQTLSGYCGANSDDPDILTDWIIDGNGSIRRRVRLLFLIRRNWWLGDRQKYTRGLVGAIEETINSEPRDSIRKAIVDGTQFLRVRKMATKKGSSEPMELEPVGAPVDKETVRGLVEQGAQFLRFLAYMSPRIGAMSDILLTLTKPDAWDKVWTVITGNPELMRSFSSVLSGNYANELPRKG